jgi:GNAT superfamily N-acetyltransferase
MPRIRPFVPGDASAVAAVIVPIQQREFGIPITLQAQPDLADIAGFYQHGNGNFWVAEADEGIVGTIGLLDIGNREVALRKMFVTAAFRGPAQGVAQGLLDRALAWCGERGVTDVYLGTTAAFLAAHRFYEKNGFVALDRSSLPAAFPVMRVDTKFYRRSLRPSS